MAAKEVTQVKEWSVEIEALTDARLDEGFADSVIEALAAHAPALSFASNRLQVRFDVEAPSEFEAFSRALKVFRRAVPKAEAVRVEIETIEELDRQLAMSNIPDLVGVAELAALLNVSRQRASELAHSRGFPKPWVVLKAGPVWKRSSVARYAGQWERNPGRPRRAVAGASGT